MRTRHQPLAALALCALIASPILASGRPADAPPVEFAPLSVGTAFVAQGNAEGRQQRRPAPQQTRPIASVRPLPSGLARPNPPLPPNPVRIVHTRALVTSGNHASGAASRMGSGFGRTYLALPGGPGHRVKICGAARCYTMTSTDAGPALFMQRAPYNRVADLNDWVWQYVSGLPLSRGVAKVSVTYL